MLKGLIESTKKADGRFVSTPAIIMEIDKHRPDLISLPNNEKMYLAYHEIPKKVCEGGHPHTFISAKVGYRPTCGVKGCPFNTSEGRTRNRSEINKKSHATWREKTGLESMSQLPGVGDKISIATKKIGKERSVKIKKTMMERHGVESYLSFDGVHAKGIVAAQSEETKAMRLETNLERYGHENPLGNAEVQGKAKATLKERYGVEYIMQSPHHKKKAAITFYNGNGIDYKRFLDDLESDEWQWPKTFTKAVRKLSEYGFTARSAYPKILEFASHLIPKRVNYIEEEISLFLKDAGMPFERSNRTVLPPRELDFYLEANKLAIEVNGIYWHREVYSGRGKDYHISKMKACEEIGVRLIQFWGFEYIRTPEICKSIISAALGRYETVINARSCEVRELTRKESSRFFTDNHIQGDGGASYIIGLLHGGEIVSAMSFAKPRYRDDVQWELMRYANKIGTMVRGGAEKLWKRKPEGSIVSYSDNRLFQGTVYGKLGFSLESEGKPSYYYTKGKELLNRVNYQKHKLKDKLDVFDESLSEWENMQMNGYDRVWDCGSKTWIHP